MTGHLTRYDDLPSVPWEAGDRLEEVLDAFAWKQPADQEQAPLLFHMSHRWRVKPMRDDRHRHIALGAQQVGQIGRRRNDRIGLARQPTPGGSEYAVAQREPIRIIAGHIGAMQRDDERTVAQGT